MNNVTLLTSSLYNFKSTNYLQYDIDRQDSITTDYFNVASQYKFTSSAKANYSATSNNNDVTIP
jgi:hypothetical protein